MLASTAASGAPAGGAAPQPAPRIASATTRWPRAFVIGPSVAPAARLTVAADGAPLPLTRAGCPRSLPADIHGVGSRSDAFGPSGGSPKLKQQIREREPQERRRRLPAVPAPAGNAVPHA